MMMWYLKEDGKEYDVVGKELCSFIVQFIVSGDSDVMKFPIENKVFKICKHTQPRPSYQRNIKTMDDSLWYVWGWREWREWRGRSSGSLPNPRLDPPLNSVRRGDEEQSKYFNLHILKSSMDSVRALCHPYLTDMHWIIWSANSLMEHSVIMACVRVMTLSTCSFK